MNSADADRDEIEVTVKPGHFRSSKRQTFVKKVFPDSGASICLGGTQHLEQFGMIPQELIPCNKRIAVVGGATLPCHGYINVEFIVNGVTTKQKLYISDKIDRIFFSNVVTPFTINSTLMYPWQGRVAPPTTAILLLQPLALKLSYFHRRFQNHYQH